MGDFFRDRSINGGGTVMKMNEEKLGVVQKMASLVTLHQGMLKRITREINILFLLVFLQAMTIVYFALTR